MGIEFARSYKASDGKCYGTIREAQHAELEELLYPSADRGGDLDYQKVVTLILDKKDQVLDILTTTDASRPKARKVNGGSKPRKKAPASPAYSDIARLEEVASQVQTEAQRVLQTQ
jgi:hypothetical protein